MCLETLRFLWLEICELSWYFCTTAHWQSNGFSDREDFIFIWYSVSFFIHLWFPLTLLNAIDSLDFLLLGRLLLVCSSKLSNKTVIDRTTYTHKVNPFLANWNVMSLFFSSFLFAILLPNEGKSFFPLSFPNDNLDFQPLNTSSNTITVRHDIKTQMNRKKVKWKKIKRKPNCKLVAADKATNKALQRIYLKFCLVKWFSFGYGFPTRQSSHDAGAAPFQVKYSIRNINKYKQTYKKAKNSAPLIRKRVNERRKESWIPFLSLSHAFVVKKAHTSTSETKIGKESESPGHTHIPKQKKKKWKKIHYVI